MAPVSLRRQLLANAEVRWNTRVATIEPGALPRVILDGEEAMTADLVIVAAGAGMPPLVSDVPPLALRGGQLEWATLTDPNLSRAVTSGRYAVAHGGRMVFGASFAGQDDDTRRQSIWMSGG